MERQNQLEEENLCIRRVFSGIKDEGISQDMMREMLGYIHANPSGQYLIFEEKLIEVENTALDLMERDNLYPPVQEEIRRRKCHVKKNYLDQHYEGREDHRDERVRLVCGGILGGIFSSFSIIGGVVFGIIPCTVIGSCGASISAGSILSGCAGCYPTISCTEDVINQQPEEPRIRITGESQRIIGNALRGLSRGSINFKGFQIPGIVKLDENVNPVPHQENQYIVSENFIKILNQFGYKSDTQEFANIVKNVSKAFEKAWSPNLLEAEESRLEAPRLLNLSRSIMINNGLYR